MSDLFKLLPFPSTDLHLKTGSHPVFRDNTRTDFATGFKKARLIVAREKHSRHDSFTTNKQGKEIFVARLLFRSHGPQNAGVGKNPLS